MTYTNPAAYEYFMGRWSARLAPRFAAFAGIRSGERVLDSLQLTTKHRVATPVNWSQGEDVIIAGSVSDEEAKKIFPHGWKAPRPYIRIVHQPPA